jgi:hypothetical protein
MSTTRSPGGRIKKLRKSKQWSPIYYEFCDTGLDFTAVARLHAAINIKSLPKKCFLIGENVFLKSSNF